MASVHTRHQLLTRLTITKPEEDRSLEAVTRVATVASSCVAVASLLEAAFYFLYNRTVRIYNFCFKLIRQNNDNLESTTLFTCSFIHGWKSFRKLSQMRKAVKVDMFLLLLRWVHETFYRGWFHTSKSLTNRGHWGWQNQSRKWWKGQLQWLNTNQMMATMTKMDNDELHNYIFLQLNIYDLCNIKC